MIGRPKNGWIGIDVGAKSLKLAQLTWQGERLELKASASVARTTGSSVTETLCNDLKTVLAIAGGLCGRRTAATLPIDSCWIEPGRNPPPASSSQTQDSRSDKPAAPDATPEKEPASDQPWSCASWPTGEESKDPDDAWYTIAVPAGEADTVADGLLDAGLSCRTIDAAPMAIARAVGMAAGAGDGCTAAIDWGETSTRLVSVVSGYPVYVRTLKNCGMRAAVDLVADELGISPDEAGKALNRHRPRTPAVGNRADVPNEDPVAEQLATLVRPVFDRLASEINRTLTHLRSHRKAATPAALCLLGGGATTPGAAAWLAAETGLPTTVWRPLGSTTDAQPWPALAPAIALSALAWGG